MNNDLDLAPIEARLELYRTYGGKRWINRSREAMARQLRRDGYIEPIVDLYSRAADDEDALLAEVKRLREAVNGWKAMYDERMAHCAELIDGKERLRELMEQYRFDAKAESDENARLREELESTRAISMVNALECSKAREGCKALREENARLRRERDAAVEALKNTDCREPFGGKNCAHKAECYEANRKRGGKYPECEGCPDWQWRGPSGEGEDGK